MTIRKIYPNWSHDDSQIGGWVVGGAIFLAIFVATILWSMSSWHSEIQDAKHARYWHKSIAQVVDLGHLNLSASVDNYRAVTLRYFNAQGEENLAVVDLPYRTKLRSILKLDIKDSGDTYIPAALNQYNNPFVARPNFFPLASILLIGICLNLIVSGVIGLLVFDSLHRVGFYVFLVPRSPSIYGMRVRPTPKKYKLVHTPDGRLIEVEVRQ